MHTKGYLCEAVFKAHGVGGFHKVVNSVMSRPKLTKEAFKKRKFQDNNLNRIKESVRDGSYAYGMAAVQEFRMSPDFPSNQDLLQNLQKFGNHNQILIQRFKRWLKESAECNQKHQYHQQLFTLFGPLLELFITAGRNGDGHLRETVWTILLPVCAARIQKLLDGSICSRCEFYSVMASCVSPYDKSKLDRESWWECWAKRGP